MFVTMVIAALPIDGAVRRARPDPDRPRPSRADIFGTISVDYKLFLNLLGLAIFGALLWLTRARGATDPACGMRVDRAKALTATVGGDMYYFCSEHCREAFVADHAPPAVH